MYEFQKNKTGNFYCGRKCLAIGHSVSLSGSNNPFYGKTHSREVLAKIVRVTNFETVECEHCKKEYSRSVGVIVNREKYCSAECSHKARRARFTVECHFCGKEVEKVNYYKDKDQLFFCSRSCTSKWYSSKQPIGEEAYWFGKKGEISPNWQGGISALPYAPIWVDKRFKAGIRERDNHTCQNPDCRGNVERLCIHHINYDKKDCEPSNLITLCTSCNSRANANREFWQAGYSEIIRLKYESIQSDRQIRQVIAV
jgi:hypothetical protein